MEVKIKNKADLESVLGKTLTSNFMKVARKEFMKTKPMSVNFSETKPKFYLDNGDMLRAYLVDIETSQVLAEAYCGSGDTVLFHAGVQLGEGQRVPDGQAILFVNTYASSQKHPWFLYVVTNNFQKQVA
jgi:hypothetical protein